MLSKYIKTTQPTTIKREKNLLALLEIGFAYASSLCMTYKMYILLVVCLVGTVIYVTSDIVRKRGHLWDTEKVAL
jgi:hypothetical protein